MCKQGFQPALRQPTLSRDRKRSVDTGEVRHYKCGRVLRVPVLECTPKDAGEIEPRVDKYQASFLLCFFWFSLLIVSP